MKVAPHPRKWPNAGKTYRDKVNCPRAECRFSFVKIRRTSSAGKMVPTYCYGCQKFSTVLAGKPKRWPLEQDGQR